MRRRGYDVVGDLADLEPGPPPEHWGGYLVRPQVVEFWQGRPSRLHDRLEYRRAARGGTSRRLQP